MGLVENTSKGSDRDLVLPRYDRGICTLASHARELNMTSLLADFLETYGFEAALDLPES